LASNSLAIAGNATFIADPINAVINDANTDTANIIPGEFLSLFKEINFNTT
jgi:3-isopropylmalate dehydratase small subunit